MERPVIKWRNNEVILYGVTILITSIAVFFAYHLWNANLFEYPLCYSGDGLSNLTATKRMILEGGLGYISSRLGAPFGFEEFDFLQNSYIPTIVKKLISIFSANYVFVYNISCLSGYVVIASVSLCVLIKLNIDGRVAVVLSVLFACSPYHFYRAFTHYSLGFYVSIPVAVYYIVKLMRGNVLEKKNHYINWNNFKYLIAMILLGTCGVYYAFFTCFFLIVAGIYILINERKLKRLLETVLSILIILCTTIVGYFPTVIYRMINGSGASSVVRANIGVQVYSLRISQLILPITNHRISFLASIKNNYNSIFSSNENDSSSLGLVFLIGFIIMLLYFWKKKNKNEEIIYLQELACLNLSALLYASSGGLILIQGLWFSSIRCGNRISIFISFFSCICVGIVSSKHIRENNIKEWIVIIGLIGLLTVGLFDQTKAGGYVNYESIKSSVDSDKAFVEEIENMEAEGSMILQLPIATWPEAGSINNMTDYSHFVGYLYSDTLKWSYGVMKGRTGSDFYEALESSDATALEIIETAAAMGYTGLYIDLDGYEEEDGNDLEEQLSAILGVAPLISANEDKLYFSLTDYIEQNNIEVTYCSFEFTDGIYGQENSDNSSWRWMQEEGQFKVYNWSDAVRLASLTFTIKSPWNEDYSFTISIGDKEETYVIHNGTNRIEFETELEPGYNSFSFSTDAPAVQSDSDSRNMHLTLRGYSIKEFDYEITYESGIYDKESEGRLEWRWAASEGSILINNGEDREIEVEIKCVLVSPQEENYSITWNLDNQVQTTDLSSGYNFVSFVVTLEPGENILDFETNLPVIEASEGEDTEDEDLEEEHCFQIMGLQMCVSQ